MPNSEGNAAARLGSSPRARHLIDRTDAKLLAALNDDPRAPVITLADRTGLSRNTVQARLARLESDGALQTFERRIDPAAVGYPLTAFILTTVTQRRLDAIAAALAEVPEVLEVLGLSGSVDLLVRVVAREADDLYRIAGLILDIEGVEKTATSLVMRNLVDFRLGPLLDRVGAG